MEISTWFQNANKKKDKFLNPILRIKSENHQFRTIKMKKKQDICSL